KYRLYPSSPRMYSCEYACTSSETLVTTTSMIADSPSSVMPMCTSRPPTTTHLCPSNPTRAPSASIAPSSAHSESANATKIAARDTGGGATRSNLPQDLLRHMQLPPRHIDRVRFKLRRLRPSRRGDHPNRKRLAVQQLLPHLRRIRVLRVHQLRPHRP